MKKRTMIFSHTEPMHHVSTSLNMTATCDVSFRAESGNDHQAFKESGLLSLRPSYNHCRPGKFCQCAFIILCFMLSISAFHAQKLQYGGMQQLGPVFGARNINLSFNLVNGIRFKRFFTGIGAEVQFVGQHYAYVSSPYNTSAIYADGRYYINKKKNFFAVADAGVNLVYEKIPSGMNTYWKRQPGYFCAIGLGFKARLGAEVFYSFDVSYNIRQTRVDYNYIDVRDKWQAEKYDYRQYAILVRMGIEIF